ncbi:bifunctional UDP-N-acetylglucosamine diphosphorylase/glucosamine-1-phosphate N-acetyltransferase GlmU [Enterovirga aerilata]|uniref:Bifunctional protein GlmU n=1 Tax=Enterovirga aerilata TaxID=2730920 RepID=A0A849I7K3_9HYPH|nr:bifunctional UDP-N-acetylglucosamine diphosphorylase/glucosamine-1-phosphate N-acetyltransferase GlmU [Enterovirga sp. DB1703]NNM72050.1 bifunctional UDP-N-acetylglucosamine diphosphorylase/glucosamine-1-phosphate N-acetyltransferase GlmU [Enterovirga sp. DB1703]
MTETPHQEPAKRERSCLAIILAAGEGTRMRSSIPKVLHRIAGRTMLAHVLDAVRRAGADRIAVVVGPDRDDVAAEVHANAAGARVFVQSERLGTAHAVLAARAALEEGMDDVVVAFADTPLVTPETFVRLREPLGAGATLAVLGFEAKDPTGYGRLIQEGGRLQAIREERDASPEERSIRLCNAGLMAMAGSRALALLSAIGNSNAKGEYYLTDAVALAAKAGAAVAVVLAPEAEVQGVNDRVQLAAAEADMQWRLRRDVMAGGATLVAPETVFLQSDTKIGRDVVVEPNVWFGPGVEIGDSVSIRSFCHIEGARVAAGAIIGPFARLRPGARLAEGVHIGNFVEVKNAELGPGVKANHLAYLGDATIGEGTNVGAGTITCNYDGARKHRTEIGPNAFIGTNTSLVAPVSVGAGAYIGSGSVITENVPAEALALGRGRQVVKEGWARTQRPAKG